MTMQGDPGQTGAIQLLGQLLGSIRDSYGDGTGADIHGVPNGVAAEIHLSSGDRFLVIVQWQGDREADANGGDGDDG